MSETGIAITFDLWDTLVIDDSDEPKRASFGLESKPKTRLALLTEELTAHHQALSPDQIEEAFGQANAVCARRWKEECYTPTVRERLQLVHAQLELSPTPGFERIVEAFSTMEADVPPDLAPGAARCLRALAARHRLGIISDAIVTPGIQLRRLLQEHGILHYFTSTVFSDEAGASKPAPRVFELASGGLGVPVERLIHIGDRPQKDVEGARRAGARSVLYTGVKDRDREGLVAAAECAHLEDLPEVIAELAGAS